MDIFDALRGTDEDRLTFVQREALLMALYPSPAFAALCVLSGRAIRPETAVAMFVTTNGEVDVVTVYHGTVWDQIAGIVASIEDLGVTVTVVDGRKVYQA
ncbi:hypothetical protein ACIOBK_34265 [Micromonospora chokoriensis]